MERISKEALNQEDFTYIEDYEAYLERVQRYDMGKIKEGRAEGRAEGIKFNVHKTALKLLKRNTPLEDIMEITELTYGEVKHIQNIYNKYGENAEKHLI